jgi:hypothetical protein
MDASDRGQIGSAHVDSLLYLAFSSIGVQRPVENRDTGHIRMRWRVKDRIVGESHRRHILLFCYSNRKTSNFHAGIVIDARFNIYSERHAQDSWPGNINPVRC